MNFNFDKKEKEIRQVGASVTVYLSLGSNDGDKRKNLSDAIMALSQTEDIKITSASDFYFSDPVGAESDSPFLNCALEIETSLEPIALLETLEEVEILLGRTTKGGNLPRTIDIDIIFYGGMVVSFPTLQVPHPRMTQRRFVLEPLAQIAPNLKHPTLNLTPLEMSRAVENQVVYVEFAKDTEV